MKTEIETNDKKAISPFKNILGEKAYQDYMLLLTRGMYALNASQFLTKKEYSRLTSYIETIEGFIDKFYINRRKDPTIGEYLTGIDTSTNQELPPLRTYDLERFQIHKEFLKNNKENQYIPDYQI